MTNRKNLSPATFPLAPEAIDRLLQGLKFNSQGLISAIAQQWDSQEVLMLAWMNAEAVRESLTTGQVCYWSRSRGKLWRKGETSGHVQKLIHFRVDCDEDCLLLLVDQTGAACHTGRRSCFYREATEAGLVTLQPIIATPA